MMKVSSVSSSPLVPLSIIDQRNLAETGDIGAIDNLGRLKIIDRGEHSLPLDAVVIC